MGDIDELYNDLYTLYERYIEDGPNEETKNAIENLLIDVDGIYLHAQNQIYEKYLELKAILHSTPL